MSEFHCLPASIPHCSASTQLSILTAVSSLCPQFRIVLAASSNWFIRPQIWSAIVGGYGSDLVNRACDPIASIEGALLFSDNKKIWEALEHQAKTEKETGILIKAIDLKQLFHGTDHLSRWKQLYEGKLLTKKKWKKDLYKYRTKPVRVFASICGAIDPDVLASFVWRNSLQGVTERLVLAEATPVFGVENATLDHLYRSVISLNNDCRSPLYLSTEAQNELAGFWDEDRTAPDGMVRSIRVSHRGKALRLALASHVSKLAMGEAHLEEEISGETMRNAILLAKNSIAMTLSILVPVCA